MIASLLAASACGRNDPIPVASDNDIDAEEETSQKCREGAERICNCEDGTGVSVCSSGRYGECECAPRDASEASADAEPPRKPQNQKPLCKAGYYAGSFSGLYRPGFVGLGIVESGVEVAVAGTTLDMGPALTLTLEEDSEGSGEFVSVSVGNGCMAGLAESGGTQTPFVARITGSLDCRSGQFEGLLNGYYTLVGIPGLEFAFTGPLRGQFKEETTSLEQGTWMIMEPEALLTGAPAGGGEGTWNAAFVAASAPDAGQDPCETVPATAGEDAGVQ